MDSSQFLQQYGIAESSLSPSVKYGINQVLRAATMAGVEQFGKIMREEAAKRGIGTGGTTASTEQQEAAARAAAEEFERQQAEEEAAKKKRIILIAVSVVLVVTVGVVIWLKRGKS